MAVAIVPPSSDQTGRPLRILGQQWRGGILCLRIRSLALHAIPHSVPPARTSHTHMALGETVRTTDTSLGSPNYLHPEDCGKLRVMWI